MEEATEALTQLMDEDYRRELTRAPRLVMGEHTYRHRLAELSRGARILGFAYPGEEIAALALVDDAEQARRFRAVAAIISARVRRPSS